MTDNRLNISPLRALRDNYIWCIHHGGRAIVVDPGSAQPVIDYLEQKSLQLVAILNTHHHVDHIGGNIELHQRYGVPVYAPALESIPARTVSLRANDDITIDSMSLSLKVIDIPGHTVGHVAFYAPSMLFCGDTLFSCGCGRLFEGTPEQMYRSLQKLVELPSETRVYCGHEYTLANIRFAKTVDPENRDLYQYENKVKELSQQNIPTLPSSIALEKAINPFLRCRERTIIRAAEKHSRQSLGDQVSVFAVLREWKNNFN